MTQDKNYMMEKSESGAKKFWRIVFGTMVGFFLSGIVLFILSFFFMIAIVSSFKPSVPVTQSNSILKITLPDQISERNTSTPFDNMDWFVSYTGLNEILECIENASTDPQIKGIYLDVSHVMAAPATVQEIRDALAEFKNSGKFIYAYNESFSQNGYYLSSVADKVVLNSQGSLEFKGIASQTLFYKGLLEKLNLDIQVVRHGQFKSAVEPFLMDKMSEANREQTSLYVNTIWNTMLENISESRNISTDSLQMIASGLLCENAQKAFELGLVDQIGYYQDVESELKQRAGIETSSSLNMISLSDYHKTVNTSTGYGKDKIAVIYATGDIVDGKGREDEIGSESFCQTLRKAYKNDRVKAIVLRVNSPGGSAMASEVIWNEIEMAKKAGKIVVTSMGDYAASGGYYIACNSDAIIAQPSTLTGSIGVFGMIPNLQNMLKTKLGVTIDVVKTNPHADYFSGLRKLDEMEIGKIQVMIEDTYATFTKRVADGRHMDIGKVDEIGQGRVWAGADALNIGLVDQLGTIQDAIGLAAKMANLDQYGIEYYPKQQDWFTKVFGNTSEENIRSAIKAEMGELYYTYSALKTIMNVSGVQARMPMEIMID